MSFGFRSKIMLLLPLCGLFIGLILPVSAMDTVDSGAHIFEFNNEHSGHNYIPGELLVKFKPDVSEEKIKRTNDEHERR